MPNRIVIVGGVAGGASAAARLRRLDEKAEIILFERGEFISFANCGLPYYIGDVIKEKEKLLVQTPEAMRARFNIDVRVFSEVTSIDRKNKTVTVKNLMNETIYTQDYDKLILSPGAEPLRPALEGIDRPRIFTLRNIPDTYAIKDYIEQNKPRHATIVGAGFIGLEMAENLHKLGIKVSIVELADHVIAPMDYDMAVFVHQHLKSKDVELYLGRGVKSFYDNKTSTTVELADAKRFETDLVIMGIGVRPDIRLAREAGLEIGATGGIKVNEYLRTSDDSIYAVGDAIEVTDFSASTQTLIPLASPANKQGRIAADNICGRVIRYEGTQGTSIVKVFDMTVALTGNNERILQKNVIDYVKSYTHSASHAGYYPGAIPLSIKLLFTKDSGKLLGAQVIGYDGVDKRIDVISTAIRAGMTVYDLEKLELAYAPPFSSAKDPVNIAGYTAANILKGDCRVFYWHEVPSIDRDSLLIDVRTTTENDLGSIPNSINIPLDSLRQRLNELPKEKKLYIFCQVGLRGYLACRILMQSGYTQVYNLSGGYKTWSAAVSKQENEGLFNYESIRTDDLIVNVTDADVAVCVDACGLQCPGPIMQVFKSIKDMKPGQVLEVSATDPGFAEDIKSWCNRTGNTLLSLDFDGKTFRVKIRKEKDDMIQNANTDKGNDKNMIIFSNDLDRALASFIIANGAAAMGRKVTMFFTFWGLNILRKPKPGKVKKDLLSRMFGFMMPRGSKRLRLSKLHIAGMGTGMMKYVMKNKNVYSLEMMIEQARQAGVKLVACNMSMDIMGIKPEELIDGVSIGGVANMLEAAEQSDATFFI